MADLISRQAAIDALHMHLMYRMGTDSNKKRLDDWINGVPSAQPKKRTEERTETHACDCISRQAAIDAILAVTGNSSVRELYEHVQEHGLSEMWSGGVTAAIDIIIALPSAQPDVLACGEGELIAQPEIIHCGECKHRDPEDHKCDCGHDIIWQLPRDDKWYCADAERKDGEADDPV